VCVCVVCVRAYVYVCVCMCRCVFRQVYCYHSDTLSSSSVCVNLCVRWSPDVSWCYNKVVQWNGDFFKAEGPQNVAVPSKAAQEWFYVSGWNLVVANFTGVAGVRFVLVIRTFSGSLRLTCKFYFLFFFFSPPSTLCRCYFTLD